MTDAEMAKEIRRQRRLERLGSNNPACGMCGENDWRCLEAHHVAGRKHDDLTACLCANCHDKVTDDQKDYPSVNQNADPILDNIGRFLRGLADMLNVIVERLYVFANTLIERATTSENGGAA